MCSAADKPCLCLCNCCQIKKLCVLFSRGPLQKNFKSNLDPGFDGSFLKVLAVLFLVSFFLQSRFPHFFFFFKDIKVQEKS